MKKVSKSCVAILIGIVLFYGCQSNQHLKFKQYLSQGEQLYKIHCMNCHQSDGSGLGKLIPPINNSFPKNNLAFTACSIKNGLEGDLNIQGKIYKGKMPANPNLTSLEIAEILTFITNSWGQENQLISTIKVDSLLATCGNY